LQLRSSLGCLILAPKWTQSVTVASTLRTLSRHHRGAVSAGGGAHELGNNTSMSPSDQKPRMHPVGSSTIPVGPVTSPHGRLSGYYLEEADRQRYVNDLFDRTALD